MNDPDAPDEKAKGQASIFAWMQAFRRLSLAGRIKALVALSIFTITPLVIIAIFGAEISGLIPIWLAGTMGVLLLLVQRISETIVDRLETPTETTLFLDNPGGLLLESIVMAVGLFGWVLGLYALLHWSATSFPAVLQGLTIGWFALTGFAISVMTSIENARRWIVQAFLKFEFGIFLTLALIIYEIVYMTIIFGSLTYALHQHGLVLLRATSSIQPTVDNVIVFYLWHFLNAIPLLDITNTVHWAVPITYEDTLIGVLVICYKILVIVPMIATFVLVLKGGSKVKE